MLTDFEIKAQNTISECNMLAGINRIVVGFSGGADSVSLLYFLNDFIKKSELNIRIIPVHVNHGLRGDESERDEEFANHFCKSIGLILLRERVDIRKISEMRKIGAEEAGRIERYRIFNKYANGSNDSKIAVAHTLSDNCETLVFNLTRGSGLKGICGIPPVRGNIIRPLINVTRGEVEEYCELNNLDYVHDSTNFERDYTRNKIRLDVLPALKGINPNFEQAVGRLIVSLRQDNKILSNISSDLLKYSQTENGYDVSKIRDVDISIKRRALAEIFFKTSGKTAEYKHIKILEKIVRFGQGAISVGMNKSLVCENDILFLKDISHRNKICKERIFKQEMRLGENFLTDIKINIIIKVISVHDYKKAQNDNGSPNNCFLDYEKLPDLCYFRFRNGGDRFAVPRRNVTKTVKKLLNEYKIPDEKRKNTLLLAHGSDVVWIEGIGVSAKYVPSGSTQHVLSLSLAYT